MIAQLDLFIFLSLHQTELVKLKVEEILHHQQHLLQQTHHLAVKILQAQAREITRIKEMERA
jgi:hypothetical protein